MTYALAPPCVYLRIPAAATKADLIAAFRDAFISVGWTSSSISGGYQLIGASPEGYTVRLKLTDGGGNAVNFQLVSDVGTGSVGVTHSVTWNSAYTWQLQVHPCGWFLSRPNLASAPSGTACCGGIPFVGTPPRQDPISLTEVYWSMGDYYGSPFFFGYNPRACLDIGAGSGARTCGIWAGVVVTGDRNKIGTPQILRYSSSAGDAGSYGGDSSPLWFGGSDILYPAFIAWGDTIDDPIRIRGQVYNAAVRSSSNPMELKRQWDNIVWSNYTDEYFFGSLFLFGEPGLKPTNVTY